MEERPSSDGSDWMKPKQRSKDPADRIAAVPGKPSGYVPPERTVIDELVEGRKKPLLVAQEIADAAYGPLKQYCFLPAGFAGRELGYEYRGIDDMNVHQIDDLNANPPPLIIDPKPAQIEAIRLLRLFLKGDSSVCRNGDPYDPMFGANFVGPPGCGKTHIMSAFAALMKEHLDEKLTEYKLMIANFVKTEYKAYVEAMKGRADPEAGTTRWNIEADLSDNEVAAAKGKSLLSLTNKVKAVEQRHPKVIFLEKLAHFKNVLSAMRHQPPDLLYLDFETLWELCRDDNETREQAFEAIIRAKVLFLDDVHPKGDIERLQIVLHVIEGRYAAGRMGTFITTNLTTDELAGGKEKHIVDRLKSRCAEMFYEVNFDDCVDWRSKVKRRRIEILQKDLQAKIKAELGLRSEANPAAEASADGTEEA